MALIEVKKKSYVRWLNFAFGEEVVKDITETFGDGKSLVSIVSRITGKMPSGIDYGEDDESKLKNIKVAFELLANDGVKINEVSPEAIVSKDIESCLSLVEQLIVRYQLGVEKGSVGVGLLKKRMMAYANEKCVNLYLPHLDNFDECFKDGAALCALLSTKFQVDFDPKKIADIPDEEKFRHITKNQVGFPTLFDYDDLAAGLIDPDSIFLFIAMIQYSPFNASQDKQSRQRSSLAVARFQRQGSKSVQRGASSLGVQAQVDTNDNNNNNANNDDIEKLNSLVRSISKKHANLQDALSGKISIDDLQNNWDNIDDSLLDTTYQNFSFSENEINTLNASFDQFKSEKNNLLNDLNAIKNSLSESKQKN